MTDPMTICAALVNPDEKRMMRAGVWLFVAVVWGLGGLVPKQTIRVGWFLILYAVAAVLPGFLVQSHVFQVSREVDDILGIFFLSGLAAILAAITLFRYGSRPTT